MIALDASARRHERDTGFTLVEVMIATVIFGLAVAAILGALFSLVKSSALHKRQSQANAVLASAAAAIVDPVRNDYQGRITGSPSDYANACSPVPVYNPTNGVTLPAGWTNANVTAAITAWDGTSTCAVGALQTVRITVTLPSNSGTWTLEAVKRP